MTPPSGLYTERVLDSLLHRLNKERKSSHGLIVTLREFEVWCRKAGFPGSREALEALTAEGSVTSYRIESARLKLFFK